ncbi:MAG: hypothetical protein H6729_14345 [Deltaproteobacteria bacterium]|nr:hypothetical protein [Deltaproteobacteria bacterium]
MPATNSRSPRRYPQIVLFVASVGCVAPSCSSSVSEPNEIEAETASEANALGNNIRFFGYYQADQPQELDVVVAYSTTLIMEGAISDERFNQLRQHGVKVFLSLASVFFEWDASCPCQVFQDANAESRWSSVRDVINRNRDVIEAFIPIDEPAFSRFPGTDAAQPMRRRDGLERIAAIVRRDIPGAKMAVNFWGDTVRGSTRNAYDFQRRYPPSYDFVGTESYVHLDERSPRRTMLSAHNAEFVHLLELRPCVFDEMGQRRPNVGPSLGQMSKPKASGARILRPDGGVSMKNHLVLMVIFLTQALALIVTGAACGGNYSVPVQQVDSVRGRNPWT